MADAAEGEVLELTERARTRLANLRYLGSYTAEEAAALGGRLVETEHGAENATDRIELWLVIDDEGWIRALRYRSLASGLHLLAFDLMAELCIGISVDQAARITPAHVQERLRLVYDLEQVSLPWYPSAPFAVLVKVANRWKGVEAEIQAELPVGERPGADWDQIGLFEKVRRIEAVLDEQVRPMLASDGGGMDLIDLRDRELHVEYRGACGSCSSAIGGTMFFIEDSLEQALGVHLSLVVQGMEPEPFVDL